MTQAEPQPDTTTHPRVDSWQAMRAWRLAIHGADLKARTKLLGLLVADHINQNREWTAWPAQATLAAVSGDGNDRRHVRERLDELIAGGWLIVTEPGGPRRAAHYALSTPATATDAVPVAVDGPTATDAVPVNGVTATDAVPVNGVMATDAVPVNGVMATDAVPVEVTGTNSVPSAATDSVPPAATESVPRSSMTNVSECIEASKTGGLDPARAHARPVAPHPQPASELNNYLAFLNGESP